MQQEEEQEQDLLHMLNECQNKPKTMIVIEEGRNRKTKNTYLSQPRKTNKKQK